MNTIKSFNVNSSDIKHINADADNAGLMSNEDYILLHSLHEGKIPDAIVDLADVRQSVSNISTKIDKFETSFGKYLPLTGGTLTGNLTVKDKCVDTSMLKTTEINSDEKININADTIQIKTSAFLTGFKNNNNTFFGLTNTSAPQFKINNTSSINIISDVITYNTRAIEQSHRFYRDSKFHFTSDVSIIADKINISTNSGLIIKSDNDSAITAKGIKSTSDFKISNIDNENAFIIYESKDGRLIPNNIGGSTINQIYNPSFISYNGFSIASVNNICFRHQYTNGIDQVSLDNVLFDADSVDILGHLNTLSVSTNYIDVYNINTNSIYVDKINGSTNIASTNIASVDISGNLSVVAQSDSNELLTLARYMPDDTYYATIDVDANKHFKTNYTINDKTFSIDCYSQYRYPSYMYYMNINSPGYIHLNSSLGITFNTYNNNGILFGSQTHINDNLNVTGDLNFKSNDSFVKLSNDILDISIANHTNLYTGYTFMNTNNQNVDIYARIVNFKCGISIISSADTDTGTPCNILFNNQTKTLYAYYNGQTHIIKTFN